MFVRNFRGEEFLENVFMKSYRKEIRIVVVEYLFLN